MGRGLLQFRHRGERGKHVSPDVSELRQDILRWIATAQHDLDRGPIEHEIDLHIRPFVALPRLSRGAPRANAHGDATLRADIVVGYLGGVQDRQLGLRLSLLQRCHQRAATRGEIGSLPTEIMNEIAM